jgi:hypothetical protein
VPVLQAAVEIPRLVTAFFGYQCFDICHDKSLPSGPAGSDDGKKRQPRRATTSISTLTSRGRRATSTVERAGLWSPKRRHNTVEAAEVLQVLDEDRAFDDLGEGRAGRRQHCAQVVEDLLGLRLDVGAGQLPSAVSGIWPELNSQPSTTMAWA